MGWVVNVKPHLPDSQERDPVPTVQKAGWAPGLVWMGAENLAPTGIQSPGRTACSKLLYHLGYPSPDYYIMDRFMLLTAWKTRHMLVTKTTKHRMKFQDFTDENLDCVLLYDVGDQHFEGTSCHHFCLKSQTKPVSFHAQSHYAWCQHV